MTPVFARLDSSFRVTGTSEAERIGGSGGGETVLEKEGHLITGIELVRGGYYGRDEVIHLEVTWQKLTESGLDPDSEVTSERLGSGGGATGLAPVELRAEPGHYITDLAAHTSDHTSGETFLHQLAIRQEKLQVPEA